MLTIAGGILLAAAALLAILFIWAAVLQIARWPKAADLEEMRREARARGEEGDF